MYHDRKDKHILAMMTDMIGKEVVIESIGVEENTEEKENEEEKHLKKTLNLWSQLN